MLEPANQSFCWLLFCWDHNAESLGAAVRLDPDLSPSCNLLGVWSCRALLSFVEGKLKCLLCVGPSTLCVCYFLNNKNCCLLVTCYAGFFLCIDFLVYLCLSVLDMFKIQYWFVYDKIILSKILFSWVRFCCWPHVIDSAGEWASLVFNAKAQGSGCFS